jgi:hypothetical protein
MSLPAKSKLIMGPWDHGPHDKVSPYAQSSTVQFDVQAEMLRFFDRHLKGVDNGIMQEPPVRYYTLGAEAWRTAQTWPPQGTRQRTWHLHPDSTLKTHQPPASAQHVLKPTYERGTGPTSRWNSQTGLYRNGTTGYPNIKAFQQPLPTYTTAPLETPLEITGFPIADLKISADTIDASVFVYLLDVAPDGQVHYITEGLFRARHRKISSAEPPYAQGGPYHSYEAADSLHLTPGQPARMKFALLPISYELPAGHRLRVAFAGLDKDHFQKIQPAPKRVTFHLGEGGCRLQLPTLQRGQASAQEPK